MDSKILDNGLSNHNLKKKTLYLQISQKINQKVFTKNFSKEETLIGSTHLSSFSNFSN